MVVKIFFVDESGMCAFFVIKWLPRDDDYDYDYDYNYNNINHNRNNSSSNNNNNKLQPFSLPPSSSHGHRMTANVLGSLHSEASISCPNLTVGHGP